mmetsp:Transcript_6047/g.10051  ORF Transcript_6047/g.10051 Transcript_6047/m.10051 type:complete len:130 (+) Transcript_6047:66-455(+)|eukprot:jgi/Bigna1/53119/estExt_Genewise1Plus.C_150176
MEAVAVVVGAGAGATVRHFASQFAKRKHSDLGPVAITAVNTAGSFILGAVVGTPNLSTRSRVCLGTGFCGALTTFSTYSMDVVTMIEAKEIGRALRYIGMNHAGGLGGATLGYLLAKQLARSTLVKKKC